MSRKREIKYPDPKDPTKSEVIDPAISSITYDEFDKRSSERLREEVTSEQVIEKLKSAASNTDIINKINEIIEAR